MDWGFWTFMLVCSLLIPLIMIGFGWRFMKKPPKDINGAYGYRTSMSMKNRDTWDFAHRTCGRVWWIVGWAMLPLTVLAQVPMLRCSTVGEIGFWSTVLEMAEAIVLVVTIIPVERALHKNFDKKGNRR